LQIWPHIYTWEGLDLDLPVWAFCIARMDDRSTPPNPAFIGGDGILLTFAQAGFEPRSSPSLLPGS
jgi:hypothetical protein